MVNFPNLKSKKNNKIDPVTKLDFKIFWEFKYIINILFIP